MREIHFFESMADDFEWSLHQAMAGHKCHSAPDFATMKYIQSHLSEFDGDITTTQMCFLETRWFEGGFRIFVHDHTGTFEIVLGEGNERTDREIRYAHRLYSLWVGGEFGLKKDVIRWNF